MSCERKSWSTMHVIIFMTVVTFMFKLANGMFENTIIAIIMTVVTSPFAYIVASPSKKFN